MSLLPYCITEADVPVEATLAGINDAALSSLIQDGMRAYYSDFTAPISGDAPALALRFHEVVRAVFQHCAVIPFRFPELLDDDHLHLVAGAHEKRGVIARVLRQVRAELRFRRIQLRSAVGEFPGLRLASLQVFRGRSPREQGSPRVGCSSRTWFAIGGCAKPARACVALPWWIGRRSHSFSSAPARCCRPEMSKW